MDTSFRSFKDIIRENESIFTNLDRFYWAHTHERKSPEGLFEHSRLVADYFEKLLNAHGLEPVINHVIDQYCKSINFSSTQRAKEIVKEIFANSIYLHDLGKVSPNFQTHLQNPDFSSTKLSFKHFHAFPGAYIFCVIHFQRIFIDNSLTSEDRNLLAFTVLCLSNPILKHHASSINADAQFNERIILLECQAFLDSYKIDTPQDIRIDIFSFISDMQDRFKEWATERSFLCMFILMKLCYSLLTACDFYATNEFMAGLIFTEFGLLDDKLRQTIIDNFRSIKDYNQELYNNLAHFRSLSFDVLIEKSTQNINILRKKMMAETITTLQNHPNSRWYYLEAPTGAGKTNLSLACISELLAIDKSLNKVFYVFPFTTLITQTFQGIKDTLALTNTHIIQVHSRAGLHNKYDSQEVDANYGTDRTLYLDHIFTNYPITVTSHVNFFDIIKGNNKQTNYIFHRLCNSIVVLDEIQSYNPKHWDKMIYFIQNYAELLNIRFVIMSATLPQIDQLSPSVKGRFVQLLQNRDRYFHNPNFIERVEFDFSLIDSLKPYRANKEEYLEQLAYRIKQEAETYAFDNNNRVRVLVEFITKNSASKFLTYVHGSPLFDDYKVYIISGDILEPRRREVITAIKLELDSKVILISTQVVEAGVDIDMDIGFKNRAILDSDEQLAGRINRNASKKNCKVFLFELDSIKTIYGKDERYKQQQLDEYINHNWKTILIEKRFQELYQKVFAERLRADWRDGDRFPSYMRNLMQLDFRAIHSEFTLIDDNQTVSVFIPKEISIPRDLEDTLLLEQFDVMTDEGKLSGEKVFSLYESIVTRRRSDPFGKKIDLKKIAGLLSLFTINLYPSALRHLESCFDPTKERFGFKYLLHHNAYSYNNGFDMSVVKDEIII